MFELLAITDIEWVFTARSDGTTFVSITNSSFGGSAQEIANLAVGSTEGFSFVLAGAISFTGASPRWPLLRTNFSSVSPKEIGHMRIFHSLIPRRQMPTTRRSPKALTC